MSSTWYRFARGLSPGTGYRRRVVVEVSKGTVTTQHCSLWNNEPQNAMKAFDLASIFIRDSQTIDLFLIKAIALFNANQHEDAMQRVKS
ncbi:hypothetical protein C8R48DRAFT_776063 [Suillus tomentosus]|nr:hypothetical protein C8R48DRAFT_776063 [Suillus tomentosus]